MDNESHGRRYRLSLLMDAQLVTAHMHEEMMCQALHARGLPAFAFGREDTSDYELHSTCTQMIIGRESYLT